jgi:hypothetical protein
MALASFLRVRRCRCCTKVRARREHLLLGPAARRRLGVLKIQRGTKHLKRAMAQVFERLGSLLALGAEGATRLTRHKTTTAL